MKKEYDIRGGQRGKYAARYAAGVSIAGEVSRNKAHICTTDGYYLCGRAPSMVEVEFCGRCLNRVDMFMDLLRKAESALRDELHAAGAEEVRQHPMLRSHQQLVDKIERALKTLEKGDK